MSGETYSLGENAQRGYPDTEAVPPYSGSKGISADYVPITPSVNTPDGSVEVSSPPEPSELDIAIEMHEDLQVHNAF